MARPLLYLLPAIYLFVAAFEIKSNGIVDVKGDRTTPAKSSHQHRDGTARALVTLVNEGSMGGQM